MEFSIDDLSLLITFLVTLSSVSPDLPECFTNFVRESPEFLDMPTFFCGLVQGLKKFGIIGYDSFPNNTRVITAFQMIEMFKRFLKSSNHAEQHAKPIKPVKSVKPSKPIDPDNVEQDSPAWIKYNTDLKQHDANKKGFCSAVNEYTADLEKYNKWRVMDLLTDIVNDDTLDAEGKMIQILMKEERVKLRGITLFDSFFELANRRSPKNRTAILEDNSSLSGTNSTQLTQPSANVLPGGVSSSCDTACDQDLNEPNRPGASVDSRMCSFDGCTGTICTGKPTCTKHTKSNKQIALENSSNSARSESTCSGLEMSYANKTKPNGCDDKFQVQAYKKKMPGSHKSGSTNSSNSSATTPKQCAEGTCMDMATRFSEYCRIHLNDWVNWMKENSNCQNRDKNGILCYQFSNRQLYCEDCMGNGVRCRFYLNCTNKICPFLHGKQK